MPKLILLRHLESQWNAENRFTGWVDVPLSKKGIKDSKKLANRLSKFKIDVIYTSPLIRNQDTVLRIFDYINKKYPIFLHFQGRMKKWANFKGVSKNYIPVYISEELNERYYGKLQGLNKAEIIKKYGAEKVRLWRRGFDYDPPGGEGLDEVVKRVSRFYNKYIQKDLKKGKNVLIVASHNSLRALAKYIEKISREDIVNLEIPTAAVRIYQFDKNLKLKSKKS